MADFHVVAEVMQTLPDQSPTCLLDGVRRLHLVVVVVAGPYRTETIDQQADVNWSCTIPVQYN